MATKEQKQFIKDQTYKDMFEQFIDALEIQAAGPDPTESICNITDNILRYSSNNIFISQERKVLWYKEFKYTLENLVRRAFTTWPKYSGYRLYPVPMPPLTKWQELGVYFSIEYTPQTAFVSAKRNTRLWFGEYGKLRRELLAHVLNELLEEYKKL